MMIVETGIEQYERENKGIKVDVEVTSNDIIEVAPAVAPTETPIIETHKNTVMETLKGKVSDIIDSVKESKKAKEV